MKAKKRKLTLPFSWYGGKNSLLKHLLPILDSVPHKVYVEPFGGSGAVLLNKKPSPTEVYNDLYGDVVHFFRMLRDHSEELVGAIELTPYSREEFVQSLTREGVGDIERARRFFVTARQVMMALASTASAGRWCVAHNQSRRGMALVVSRWLSATEGLMEVAQRLKTVVIENEDACLLIPRYDGAETLFFLDPPYLMGTRSGGKGYLHEMSDDKHEQLLEIILACKGKVALCGYDNDLYGRRLANWHCSRFRHGSHCVRFHKGKELSRQECLWTNWRPEVETN